MYPTIKTPTCQTPFTKPSHTNQPSNSQESTQSSSPHQSPLPPVAPHPHHYLPPGTEQPGRRVPVGYDSAGGELILGWRKSALFLAEFRQPRSSPRRSPEQTGTRLPGVRHPPSTTKKSAPQPIQTTKNALLISISLQSYTITYDQHTTPYDRIKYNS